MVVHHSIVTPCNQLWQHWITSWCSYCNVFSRC